MAKQDQTGSLPFKAETRKLLDILIHSLYSDRDVFLRELISNASDALTRIDFEMLTNREVLNPEIELSIHIDIDSERGTLTISDSGIGMTADEMRENLGTIAHSGAKEYINSTQGNSERLNDVIGQFGVGFYSVFMVADSVQVTSRSYLINASSSVWSCTGSDHYTIEPGDRSERGTSVVVHIKEDAKEYLQETHIKEVIRKHSDFISFPIYLGGSNEQVNRQTALWRQLPRSTDKNDYDEFYRQLTLDFSEPLYHSHLVIDAPVQLYALLYIPTRAEHGIFSLRREDGLKLYSRKVLIQEYCKDLLPEYFNFIQGIVDSEDLPLNVARETYQTTRIITQLRKLLTSKVLEMLTKLSVDEKDTYHKFWAEFGRHIKEGIAIEQETPDSLYPLVRFHSSKHLSAWTSLDEYITNMKDDQREIYYLLGVDSHSVANSPHLEALHNQDYEVLLLTEPIDSFMLMRLKQFKEFPLVNIADAKLKLPSIPKEDLSTETTQIPTDQWSNLITRFKEQLGEQVADVRMTDRLMQSPARLVDEDGTTNPELQRVYQLLHEDYKPPKKILELNPGHPILIKLNSLASDDERSIWTVEQIYENALLIEGLHPNPASMITRIQRLIESAIT